MKTQLKLLLTVVVALISALAPAASARKPTRPEHAVIVIGHRGASGYRPEHTLAAYITAIQQGADYIEPDIVATKDGYLVARHENEIGGTTDVSAHPEFDSRKVTKVIDGNNVTGWFTEDFTLRELRTLRAKERLPAVRPDNTAYDGEFLVPTLEEVCGLARLATILTGRTIGIYPETKHPTYFQSIGLPLEERLVKALHLFGYRGPNAPAIIQSFETANLKKLRKLTRLPLAQLLDAAGRPYDFVVTGDTRTYADLAMPAGLAEIATYADGVGANKNLIIPRDATGKLLAPTTLVADAHAAGLSVHSWTFRRENSFLPADFRIGTNPNDAGDLVGEIKLFIGLGIDGFFTDNPDIGYKARDEAGL